MFKAILKMEGKEYDVVSCSYSLDRGTDQTGRPSTEVFGGMINLTIESSQETLFYDWMINAYAQKDGEVEFYKRDDPSPAKVLKFSESYMINYGESFSSGGSAMMESFTVSARKLTLGGTFEKKWPV